MKKMKKKKKTEPWTPESRTPPFRRLTCKLFLFLVVVAVVVVVWLCGVSGVSGVSAVCDVCCVSAVCSV